MFRLRIVLLFTSLEKCCGVGLFLLTMEVCFGEILKSVDWQMIYSSDLPALGSLQRKERRYEKRKISPTPQHFSKLVNRNTILKLNIASYFLNILASPDESTRSTTGGPINKTIKHLGLTRHHRKTVERTWHMVNKCK